MDILSTFICELELNSRFSMKSFQKLVSKENSTLNGLNLRNIAKSLCKKFGVYSYLTQHVDHNLVFGYLHRGWCHQYKNGIGHSYSHQEPKRPIKNKVADDLLVSTL